MARRKKEWFDKEAFWRETYPFMFPKTRFADTPEQMRNVLKLTKPKGKNILDLCCGPGRCSVWLAQQGYAVTGVDRTNFLLNKARARARTAKVKVEWIQQDMRDFVRPDSFDLVISMFTSFGYFDDKSEDVSVLANMFTSLKAGGRCLIDVKGKENLAGTLEPTTSETLPNGSVLVQNHEIFDDWTRIRNEWIVIRKGRSKSFKFHLTIYSGQELQDRLESVGFRDVRLYGSLGGEEYGPDANRLIVVGTKSGLG